MEFGILGQLEVRGFDGEPLALGRFKQRALLALLLINANDTVSTDRILDELWGDEAAGKHNALWVNVSQLRSSLEPDRTPPAASSMLLSRAPGYVLQVDADDIDAHRFELKRAQGTRLLEDDPEAAARVLREALELWRGHALEDFLYEEFAQHEIARLEELRIQAVEARIEADLRLGRGPELVGELEALVRDHPERERLTGQLMLALYRSGRQSEAVRAYGQLAARLRGSLGIEPSQSIRTLDEQIVLQDPELLPPTHVTGGPAPGLAVRGYELREEIGRGSHGVVFRTFQRSVGREVAIKVIRTELADDADFIRRFEAEAHLVASLEHPHIVPLHDYWREPGGAYLVMRLMRGGSLADHIPPEGLPEERAATIVGQVAGALAAAHEHGVVHRDIKPTNILLDDDGDAYLADFGVAAVAPHTTGQAGLGVVAPFASPEHLRRAPLSVRSDVFSLGVVLRDAVTGGNASGRSRGEETSSLLDVAERATASSPEDRYPDVEAFLSDLRVAAGRRVSIPVTGPTRENPYKGLRPFGEADADTFFGRERLVERLVDRVGSPGVHGRFVLLVGPSGSGKSSVIKAGLLPALRRGAVQGSSNWFIAEMTPGAGPFEALEAALRTIAVDPPADLLEQLLRGERGLRSALAAVLPSDDAQLVLVVDQLEELFTQTEDEATRTSFLDGLRLAVTQEPSRLRVVATLRADFYDRPLGYQDLGELIRTGTEVITPMSPDELELAIARPAELAGVALELGLAATVAADVAAEPGALPLMQYVMTELFERRKGAALTVAAYRELGTVAGALGRRAEELFGSFRPDGADAVRQIFLRLVALGEGGEPTRRRVLRSELRAIGRSYDVDRVLEIFGQHRLFFFDRNPVSRSPTVEVAHEALLQEWPRCRGWIEQNRSDVLYQRRLALTASEWQEAGEGRDHLLTGARLAEAEAWQQSTDLALTDLERRLVTESVAHAAQTRRARRRRRRITSAVLGVVGAAAVGFLVFALTQRSAASRLEAVGEVNRLIGAAEDEVAVDPELSLLLAGRAAEKTRSLGMDILPANLEVLHQGLRNHRLLFRVDGATDAAFSPDAKRVYVGMADGGVSIRNATTGAEVGAISATLMAARASGPLALSDDGRWLTNGYVVVDTASHRVIPLSSPGSRLPVIDVDIARGLVATSHFVRGADARGEPGRVVEVWNRRTGEEVWRRHVVAPIRVDLSADGTLLAVTNSPVGGPYSTIVFDTATGEATAIPLPVETIAASFGPTGKRLFLGVGDVIRRWEVDSRSFSVRRDGGHDAPISDLDVSGDGSLIVSGDQAGGVIVRDAVTGEAPYPLPRHAGTVFRVELSADGTRLATRTQTQYDETGVLRVFDTSTAGGRDLLTMDTGLPKLATVDADPSGALLAIGDHTGSRQLWAGTGGLRLDLARHAPFEDPSGIGGPIAVSPDGTRLVTGDASGVVRVWDVATGGLLTSASVAEIAPNLSGQTLTRSGDEGRDVVFAVAYSPDGRLVAIAGAGFVLVADAETLGDGRVLHESPITFTERVAFSSDGTRLIAGAFLGAPPPAGFTNPVIVWDVTTGEEISRFPGGIPGSPAVDYSPAGDLVAVGSSDVTIRDTTTWAVTHRLESSSENVWDVAFSPDGEVVAVGYDDGTIRIWDPHTGLPLYRLPGHDGPAADLDWTADGSRLVSVGLDGAIRVFVTDPAELVALARARVTRALTDQECRQYLGGEDCQV